MFFYCFVCMLLTLNLEKISLKPATPLPVYFFYDYDNGNDGSRFTSLPFFLSGAGIIKKDDILKMELKNLKEKIADKKLLASITYTLIYEHKKLPKNLLPKKLTDSEFSLDDIFFSVAHTNSSKGKNFVLFLEKNDAIVGILYDLTAQEKQSIEKYISDNKEK